MRICRFCMQNYAVFCCTIFWTVEQFLLLNSELFTMNEVLQYRPGAMYTSNMFRSQSQTCSNANTNAFKRKHKCIRMQTQTRSNVKSNAKQYIMCSKKAPYAFAFKRVCVCIRMRLCLRLNAFVFAFERVCDRNVFEVYVAHGQYST